MRAALGWLACLAVGVAGCYVTSDNSLSTSKKTELTKPSEEIPVVAVGHVVPEIAGEDVDGKELRLSDYRGKVVLLDFWGNW